MDQAPKPERRALPYAGWRKFALAVAALAAVAAVAIGYRNVCLCENPTSAPMQIVPLTSYPGFQRNARFSPDGNRIAFTWYGDKDYNQDIYVKRVGEEKPLRLTTDPASDDSPAWSPDGRYIAFRRRGKGKDAIYVVPASGGLERKLHTLNSGGDPESFDWSPDGKYLAFVDRGADWSEIIYLLAVDNPKDRRPLTTPVGRSSDYFPRFSPDGRNIAFVRSADVSDIFLVSTAGGEPKRLTLDSSFIHSLDWTPDGAHIVFSSDRLGGSVRLWRISTSGGQPEPLSTPPGLAEESTLSRDGRSLAFTQDEFNANIWRYEIPRPMGQSSAPTKLIAAAGYNASGQFSPDGKRIAFFSSRTGKGEIWVCDSDGSSPRQLTSSHVPVEASPHWSPDGREIAYQASPEGHVAIYVVSAEGGRPRRLTTADSRVGAPSWSRDGKWIYFGSDESGAWQVWKVPPEGGRAVQVTKKGGYAALESRDGKTLYYAKRLKLPGFRKSQGLWKVPAQGGKETLVLKELAAGLYDCWDLSGDGIYFYNDHSSAIDFFSFATHEITQIAKPEKQGGPLAISPDGRWILSSQLDLHTSHIMLVENFRW